MSKKPCKECPWVVRNHFNNVIIDHSKNFNKPHNCHMIPPEKRGGLWDCKRETKCTGRTLYETQKNKL